uniref:Uncharacterized protein n=1 Tax=Plectus sambesii TaxID=2011161 RepID=A0A914VLI8_9BILA
MATRVNVCNVDVLDNPATFFSPFQLEITFEVFEHLPHDLEWKLIYVGSAETESYDQVLDTVLVGPIPEGRHKFVFQADAPDPTKIPPSELVGVTVVLLTCSYRAQQFIKIGWFVANEYTDPELKENPPQKPLLDKLSRTVLTTDVRVTTIAIKWEDAESTEAADAEAIETDHVTDHATESSMPTTSEQVESTSSESSEMSSATKTAASTALSEPLSDVTNGRVADVPME